MFPPCTYEGHVKPGDRRYCRLTKPAKLVHLSKCMACPYAGNFSTRLEPICIPPLYEPSPCVHRGELLRTETITSGCCGKEAVPVLSCAKFGECTLDKKTSLQTCEGCPEHLSPGAAALPPLTGPANLMWFAYVRRDAMKTISAQQEMIRNSRQRFTGKTVCALAVDDSTDTTIIDRSLFDEVIELPNDPLSWELPGWRWAMERMKDEPGFTVRLHAKGAARGVQEQHMAQWWELAYETLLDVSRVRSGLLKAAITGVFRRNVWAENLGVPWHYTGSFYAFRNDAVFSGDWLPVGTVGPSHYVEAWPALMASRDQAGCIAWDGCQDLYQTRYWRGVPKK